MFGITTGEWLILAVIIGLAAFIHFDKSKATALLSFLKDDLVSLLHKHAAILSAALTPPTSSQLAQGGQGVGASPGYDTAVTAHAAPPPQVAALKAGVAAMPTDQEKKGASSAVMDSGAGREQVRAAARNRKFRWRSGRDRRLHRQRDELHLERGAQSGARRSAAGSNRGEAPQAHEPRRARRRADGRRHSGYAAPVQLVRRSR
jgi:hypothetical protein